MKKKRILFGFLIFISSTVFLWATGDTTSTGKNIEPWLRNMRILRKSLIDTGKATELERLDQKILTTLREKNFVNSEKETARLIGYIITSRNYYSTINIALALEILYSEFSDKNYFLNTVFDLVGYDFMSNYHILTTVLTGFRKCIGTNEEKLFKSYRALSPCFDSFLYDHSKLGSASVITALILFMNDYFILVEDGKLKGRYSSEVENTFSKIDFSSHGDFEKYYGAESLEKNFTFYENNRRQRGEY